MSPLPHTPDIHTRPATDADFPAMSRIYRDCRAGADWISPDAPPSDLAAQSRGEALYVAELHGRIVGFIAIWEPQRFVHHLYVAPDSQGRGIGPTLIADAKWRYPGGLSLKCVIANRRALRFYLRHGWTQISRGRGINGPYARLRLPDRSRH